MRGNGCAVLYILAIPLKEAGFGTLEEQVLYEIAAGFDTQAHANRFLAIYRENGMGVLPFVETYMDIYRQSLLDAAGKATGDKAGSAAQGAHIVIKAVKELGPLTLDKGTLGIVNHLREAEGVPGLDSGAAAAAPDAQASLEEIDGNGIMEVEGRTLQRRLMMQTILRGRHRTQIMQTV